MKSRTMVRTISCSSDHWYIVVSVVCVRTAVKLALGPG
jgi:hypothetical protein